MVGGRLTFLSTVAALVLMAGTACAQWAPFGDRSILKKIDASFLGDDFRPAFKSPRLFAGFSPGLSSIGLDLNAQAGFVSFGHPFKESADILLEWKTNGMWFGGSLPLSLTPASGFNLEAMIFLPFTTMAQFDAGGYMHESYDPGESERGQIRHLMAQFDVDLEQTCWFTIDLNAEKEFLRNLSFMAGVRYDYLQSALHGPEYFRGEYWERDGDPPSTAPVYHYSADIPLDASLDLDLNSIFPYVGFKSVTGNGSSRLITMIKAAPLALRIGRDAPYKSYLMEFQMDYHSRDIAPGLDLDLFCKYTHAQGFFQRTGNISGELSEDIAPLLPDYYHIFLDDLDLINYDQEMTVTVKQLILGAGFTWDISFDLL